MVAMSSTDIAFIDQTVADVQRESINQGFTLAIFSKVFRRIARYLYPDSMP